MKKTCIAIVLSLLACVCLFFGACNEPLFQPAGDVKTEHYFETLDGDFVLDETLTETKIDLVGASVTAEPITKEGYVFDEANENNVTTATVVSGGVTLKFYYLIVEVDYTIRRYFENIDGSFLVNDALTETVPAKIGATATVEATNVAGYVFDEANENNVTSATVLADGSTVLKLYYALADIEYTVEHYFEVVADNNNTVFEVNDSLTEVKSAKMSTTVTAEALTVENYVFDSNNENNVTRTTLTADGGTLKFYYELKEANYSVEHYFEKLDGTFAINETLTATKSAKIGMTVEANGENASVLGYLYDNNNGNAVFSATVLADGTTVLKLYYVLEEYEVTIITSDVETLTVKYGKEVELIENSAWTWAVVEGEAQIVGNELTGITSDVTVKAVMKESVTMDKNVFTNPEGELSVTMLAPENGEKQGIIFLHNLPRTQNLTIDRSIHYSFYVENETAYIVRTENGVDTVLESDAVTLNETKNTYKVAVSATGFTAYVNDVAVVSVVEYFNFAGRAGVIHGETVPGELVATHAMSLDQIKSYAIYVIETLWMDIYKVNPNSGYIIKEGATFRADMYASLIPDVQKVENDVRALTCLDDIIAYMVAENGILQGKTALYVAWSSINTLIQDFTYVNLYWHVGGNGTDHVIVTSVGGMEMSTDMSVVDTRWYIPDAYRIVSNYGSGLLNYYYAALTAEGNVKAVDYIAVMDKYILDFVRAVAMHNFEFWYSYNKNKGTVAYNEWTYLWSYIGAANTGYQYNGSVANYSWPGDWRLPNALYSATDIDTIVNYLQYMMWHQT